jgi:hypothetical protein
MFSFQGIVLGAAWGNYPELPAKRSPLGLLPMPTPKHILFFRPEILLDWPHVKEPIYLVLFGLSNSVYIHNPKDLASNDLKRLGYHFGDTLRNDTHPIVMG